MQPVKIKIVSKGTSDGEKLPVTEHHYQGQLAEKSGKYYVIYEEDAQSGWEGTKTTIKWDNERVIIIRNGGVEHRQEFCKGLTAKSLYRTPYMEIPLTTETTYLNTSFADGLWRLEVEYILSHGDAPYGVMEILIEIEEETEVGH